MRVQKPTLLATSAKVNSRPRKTTRNVELIFHTRPVLLRYGATSPRARPGGGQGVRTRRFGPAPRYLSRPQTCPRHTLRSGHVRVSQTRTLAALPPRPAPAADCAGGTGDGPRGPYMSIRTGSTRPLAPLDMPTPHTSHWACASEPDTHSRRPPRCRNPPPLPRRAACRAQETGQSLVKYRFSWSWRHPPRLRTCTHHISRMGHPSPRKSRAPAAFSCRDQLCSSPVCDKATSQDRRAARAIV